MMYLNEVHKHSMLLQKQEGQAKYADIIIIGLS